jgi:RHS repeat-associated protein
MPSCIVYDEGRVVYANNSRNYFGEVYLKDHLGNVRVARRRENGVLKTRQVDSYYPFGMNIKGLSQNSTDQTRPNEYLYNGKQMQDEMGLGWLDYGARMYDPALGRFHVPDPLIEWHFNTTPYHYCFNNPINLIDIFGLDTTNVNSGNNVKPQTPNQPPPVMLNGPTIRPKWYQKVKAWWHNLSIDGDGGSQPGGFHLVTSTGDPASSTKQKAEHDVDQVNVDLLLLAISYAQAGGRPTGWESLTPAELAQRVKDITESSQALTSDKEIVKKSGGNNEEIIIKKTYDVAKMNNTEGRKGNEKRLFNEGDTVWETTTYKSPKTGETRKVTNFYKKNK